MLFRLLTICYFLVQCSKQKVHNGSIVQLDEESAQTFSWCKSENLGDPDAGKDNLKFCILIYKNICGCKLALLLNSCKGGTHDLGTNPVFGIVAHLSLYAKKEKTCNIILYGTFS